MTRLDQALVTRGLVSSRTAAARHIQAGEVLVNGQLVMKPATRVSSADTIDLAITGPQYASRAGHKLAGALDIFDTIDITDTRCLDAGASTGGFTDVLLQRGAREVAAVDVGHDQLIDRIRHDARVQVYEGLNVRYLTLEDLGEPVQIVVSDLSFISLKLVMEALVGVTVPGAHLILMVKPQFEIGRDRLPKTGVVVDPEQRREAVYGVVETAIRCGVTPRRLAASPLPGQDGNKEFFFWATNGAGSVATEHRGQTAKQWFATQSVQWADEVR